MESTAFFEKKISLTPRDFNEVKNSSVETLLLKKSKETLENKCSEQGFVLPGSITLLSRSMGYFESARFTGDAVYYVKLEGKIVYPADGILVVGEVIRKNKMGLYVNYNNAIRIQVPRDLHLGDEGYDNVQVGNKVQIELKRSKFAINDAYILASGKYIANLDADQNVSTETQDHLEEKADLPETEEEEEETEAEAEEEDEEDEEDVEDEDE